MITLKFGKISLIKFILASDATRSMLGFLHPNIYQEEIKFWVSIGSDSWDVTRFLGKHAYAEYFFKGCTVPATGLTIFINPGINLRADAINSNVSVSPRRNYHTYGDIIIHTTTSHTFVRVYNHE